MKDYNNYNNKNQCPHIRRNHGPEYSLIMELVLNPDATNLFPPPNYYTFKQKKLDSLNGMYDDDSEYSGYSFIVNNFSQRNSIKKDSNEKPSNIEDFFFSNSVKT